MATVFVRKGKGNKDRMVHVGAKTVKANLRYYAVRGVPKPNDPVWLSKKRSDSVTIQP